MKKNDIKKAAAILGSIKSPKKAASSRENGKKGGRPKKDRITIYLDAGTDLSVACLPDSRKDIEKFEREYKRAAKQYAKEHDMIIDVETDPTVKLPDDFDEPRHTEVWQAIHNMIPKQDLIALFK